MNTQSGCLNEDMLIKLVIDPGDLALSTHNHLNECSRCQTEIKQFEQELAAFGRLAKRYAPTPRKRKAPPTQQAGTVWRFPQFYTRWQRLALAGSAIVLLMCAVLWQWPVNSSIDTLKMPTIAETIDEPPLVTDIIPSEDSHLSEIIKQVAYDANSYLEDEFIEFVGPFEFDQNPV